MILARAHSSNCFLCVSSGRRKRKVVRVLRRARHSTVAQDRRGTDTGNTRGTEHPPVRVLLIVARGYLLKPVATYCGPCWPDLICR